MTILALEFSSEQRSVALARDGQVLAEAVETGGYRVTNAFALIRQVLAQAGLAPAAVEVIAVGVGPGSYTGIRAAIAVAQGWQLARGVQLLGVSSAECLAAQAQAAQIFGRVNVVLDAQRGEFYLATWELSPLGRQELAPLAIVAAAGVASRKAAGEMCVGPAADRVLFPSATMVARLAADRVDFVPGDQLMPIYLRETTFAKAPPCRVY